TRLPMTSSVWPYPRSLIAFWPRSRGRSTAPPPAVRSATRFSGSSKSFRFRSERGRTRVRPEVRPAIAVTGPVRTSRLGRVFSSSILVRVTTLGLGFIRMTLVVAIGATNTGNNGLYILVSLFLATLLVSGVVSRRNVEKLPITLEGPAEIFAGEAARFTLRLKNRGRLPRRAILVKISGAA